MNSSGAGSPLRFGYHTVCMIMLCILFPLVRLARLTKLDRRTDSGYECGVNCIKKDMVRYETVIRTLIVPGYTTIRKYV